MKDSFYTYIVLDNDNVLFEIDVTTDIKRRKHLLQTLHNDKKLKWVYYEEFPLSIEALQREQQWKHTDKQFLIAWIKENNPLLVDVLQQIDNINY